MKENSSPEEIIDQAKAETEEFLNKLEVVETEHKQELIDLSNMSRGLMSVSLAVLTSNNLTMLGCMKEFRDIVKLSMVFGYAVGKGYIEPVKTE